MTNAEFLGVASYPGILNAIRDKFVNTKCDTLSGNELVNNFFVKFNESATPMLELKEFKTKAELVAKDDASLADIIKFCNTKQAGGDLNFLINVAKEEHFAKMTRAGFPDPKLTIKSIEEEFDQPSSVVAEGIKSGLFDSLESDILKTAKDKMLGTSKKEKPKALNESAVLNGTSVIKYSPVGIRFENKKEGKLVYLMESVAIDFNPEKAEYMLTDNSQTPDVYRKLIDSINSCKYNPETQQFSPAEEWDFELTLDAINKTVKGNGRTLDKGQVRTLLLESVKAYETSYNKPTGYDKMRYLAAADKFIMMCENAHHLIKFDTLDVYRDMNESDKFLMVNRAVYDGTGNPQIIASSNSEVVGMFESVTSVVSTISNFFGTHDNNFKPMFESAINSEIEANNFRNGAIEKVREDISVINTALSEANKIKMFAESGSAMFDKVNTQINDLQSKLDTQMDRLNTLVNHHKIV